MKNAVKLVHLLMDGKRAGRNSDESAPDSDA